MQDRPSFVELLEAVRHFLEEEVAPKQTDHRDRFRTLVAINALTILEREAEHETGFMREEARGLAGLLGTGQSLPDDPVQLHATVLELERELAARIRRGEAPAGTVSHLREVAENKLRVASPRYLERTTADR